MFRVSRIQARKKFDKAQYGSNWKSLAEECKKRDCYSCTICGKQESYSTRYLLEAHHRIPLTKGGRNVLSNLVSLCNSCHKKQHKHL